jgi:hypothetical protein
MRLEERRVLNADAATIQQLVVDAGAAANDGHADTFHIEQADNEIRVSLNGQEVGRAAFDRVGSVAIRGSSDDDVIMADIFGGRAGASLELRIDGDGGHDVLKLSGPLELQRVS